MQRAIRFFSSVRMSVIILILLTAGSFVGTIFINYDVYHSIPFRILLGLFSLNLISCSIDRLPGVWRRIRIQDQDYVERYRAGKGLEDEVTVSASAEDAISSSAQALKSFGSGIKEARQDDGTLLYSRRGAYAEFGPYVVHLAVLLILMGGYMGSSLGFKAEMVLYEGEKSDSAITQDREHYIPLGFTVQCRDFEVEYYDSGAPKDYRTHLAVLSDDGDVVDERQIEVNHPWFYRGIGFYQQRWGQDRAYLFHARSLEDGSTFSASAALGDSFEIRGSGLVLMPVRDFRDAPAADMDLFHGLFLHVFSRNKMQGHLKLEEGESVEAFGYSLSYEPGQSRLWTGLELVRDPGIPFVWSGFAVFCMGLFFSFISSYQRIWIKVKVVGQYTVIEFFGTASRNRAALDRRLNRIKDELVQKLGKV